MANTTWNPSDKSVNITLTGSNLIVTGSTNTASNARAVDKQITGKFYWECTFTAVTGVAAGVGIFSPSFSVSAGAFSLAGSVGTCGVVRSSGTIYSDGVIISGAGLGTIANGTAVCIAVDCTARLIWFRSGAAGNWNNSAAANPVTGTGGVTMSLGVGIPVYPAVALTAISDQITANFGDTAFTGTVPSGFTSGFTAGVSSSTNTIATQTALEEWITANALAQVTQISLEQWASVAAFVPPVPGKGRVWVQS